MVEFRSSPQKGTGLRPSLIRNPGWLATKPIVFPLIKI
jgi:hypothetical protein